MRCVAARLLLPLLNFVFCREINFLDGSASGTAILKHLRGTAVEMNTAYTGYKGSVIVPYHSLVLCAASICTLA